MEISYKGYTSTVKFDDGIYHGKIDNIKDFVNYETSSKFEIEKEFQKAVDDYIEFKFKKYAFANNPVTELPMRGRLYIGDKLVNE